MSESPAPGGDAKPENSPGEHYRVAFDNSLEAIVIAQDGVLRVANPATAKLSGHPLDELIGMPFLELIAPEDHEKTDRALRAQAPRRHRQSLPYRPGRRSRRAASPARDALDTGPMAGTPRRARFPRRRQRSRSGARRGRRQEPDGRPHRRGRSLLRVHLRLRSRSRRLSQPLGARGARLLAGRGAGPGRLPLPAPLPPRRPGALAGPRPTLARGARRRRRRHRVPHEAPERRVALVRLAQHTLPPRRAGAGAPDPRHVPRHHRQEA